MTFFFSLLVTIGHRGFYFFVIDNDGAMRAGFLPLAGFSFGHAIRNAWELRCSRYFSVIGWLMVNVTVYETENNTVHLDTFLCGPKLPECLRHGIVRTRHML